MLSNLKPKEENSEIPFLNHPLVNAVWGDQSNSVIHSLAHLSYNKVYWFSKKCSDSHIAKLTLERDLKDCFVCFRLDLANPVFVNRFSQEIFSLSLRFVEEGKHLLETWRRTVVHSIYTQNIFWRCLVSLSQRSSMRVVDWCHRVTPIGRESAPTVAHHTPNIVRNIEVTNLWFRPKREVFVAFRSNVFPIDSNELVAIERVLHVMKAKGVNKLVDDCVEPEAASANGVWL